MNTLPLFMLDELSAIIKLNLDSCKLSSWHEISELRKVSERYKMSTILFEI